MAEKWKVVAGVSAGVIIFEFIAPIVYSWFADPHSMDCFMQGKQEGRDLLNRFLASNGEDVDPEMLKPTNYTDLNNDCQYAHQHGFALGVTQPVVLPATAALVGSLAFGLAKNFPTRQGQAATA